jgi:BirA family biotin operon repressor/biotin-[acetyl-CoA-carboxylase] ligase
MHYHRRMSISPRELIAALSAERAVSGSELARALGVTRAAVWKQIELLREIGAPIEGAAGSGYRLAWPLELLDAQRICAALDAPLRARARVDAHWQIDSTNAELQRRAAVKSPARALRVCLAEAQSAGRGRRGRVWQSPLGGNLYFSLLRRFQHGMGSLAGMSLVAGVATIAALEDCGIGEAGLKWPNDVLARGRKLAGILVELGGEFLGPCHAVIGIGINLRLAEGVRARIDQPAIDLATLAGDAALPSRNQLAARLIVRLAAALDRFEAEGFAAFRDDYARSDLLDGQPVRVSSGRQTHAGVAAGVDERGALRVRCGKLQQLFDSADVSVRPVARVR